MLEEETLLMANTIPMNLKGEKLNQQIFKSNLIGLANNVKWNRLIKTMRNENNCIPYYRYKWINGYVSQWDMEWYYHLPFPFKGVLWFDMSYCKITKDKLITKQIINNTQTLIYLVQRIGFEYETKNNLIRIFGYGPKDYSNFS